MEQTLWELFCETGDPMGYLLYREELRSGPADRGTVPGGQSPRRADGPGTDARQPERTVQA